MHCKYIAKIPPFQAIFKNSIKCPSVIVFVTVFVGKSHYLSVIYRFSKWVFRLSNQFVNYQRRRWFMSSLNFPDLLEACVSPARLLSAWQKVRENGGCAGGDGQTIASIASNSHAHLQALAKDLKNGTYHPRGYRRLDIRKRSGGTRPLAIPSVRDRVAQTAVS